MSNRLPIGNNNTTPDQEVSRSNDPNVEILRRGIHCSQLIEAIPNFVKAPCEKEVKGQNNHYIVFGRDRPSKRASGYGGRGDEQASMIDMVVGRMASDVKSGVETDNNIPKDAARIYVSQKTDIDDNFNLSESKNDEGKYIGVPHSVAKSGIGIKADAVRIVAREGIRLVTRVDDTNSAGDDISKSYYGIDLVAGNKAENLQPLVKGDNLVLCLKRLVHHVQKLTAIVDGLTKAQQQINRAFARHRHISSDPGGQTQISIDAHSWGNQACKTIAQTHIPSFKSHRTNLQNFEKQFLEPMGAKSILSAYNRVN